MATYVSGTSGKVTVDGSDLHVTGWDANIEQEILETTNTGSSGYKESIYDVYSASGSVSANYDTDTEPGGHGIGLGATIALVLYVGSASGGTYSFPTARISSFPVSSAVRSVVTSNFNWESTGTFTLPS